MSPAALVGDMWAVKCTASLFAVRHSSHAKLRAIVAHELGALRVHYWGNRHSTSAPGEAATTDSEFGTQNTPTFKSEIVLPSGNDSDACPDMA
eukprot:3307882-Pleurochrysis_carterae.AAC.1